MIIFLSNHSLTKIYNFVWTAFQDISDCYKNWLFCSVLDNWCIGGSRHMQIIRKNIFACLSSVRNTISLSRHEQVCLVRLRFERYFSQWWEKYLSKRSLIEYSCSWRNKLIVLKYKLTCLLTYHSLLTKSDNNPWAKLCSKVLHNFFCTIWNLLTKTSCTKFSFISLFRITHYSQKI